MKWIDGRDAKSWVPLIVISLALSSVLGWKLASYQMAEKSAESGRAVEITKSSEAVASLLVPASAVSSDKPSSAESAPYNELVARRLKSPLSRLGDFVKNAEKEREIYKQVGDSLGDTIIRVEIPPPQADHLLAFRKKAEEELSKTEPEFQSFLLVKIQRLEDQFLNSQKTNTVLFIKQTAKRSREIPSLQYWSFDTDDPNRYSLSDDGQIVTPIKDLPEIGNRWLDRSTFKPPSRFAHLVQFNFKK